MEMILDASTVTAIPSEDWDNSAPETMQLDINRIITFYNDITDVTLMSSLIVLYKEFCKPVVPGFKVVQEIKKDLWVLLNDDGTTLDHVGLFISKKAGEIRGRELVSSETKSLISMIEKTLNESESGPLFKLMQKRVGTALLLNLLKGRQEFAGSELTKLGLDDFAVELKEQYSRLKAFCDYNGTVYQSVHSTIWKEIN